MPCGGSSVRRRRSISIASSSVSAGSPVNTEPALRFLSVWTRLSPSKRIVPFVVAMRRLADRDDQLLAEVEAAALASRRPSSRLREQRVGVREILEPLRVVVLDDQLPEYSPLPLDSVSSTSTCVVSSSHAFWTSSMTANALPLRSRIFARLGGCVHDLSSLVHDERRSRACRARSPSTPGDASCREATESAPKRTPTPPRTSSGERGRDPAARASEPPATAGTHGRRAGRSGTDAARRRAARNKPRRPSSQAVDRAGIFGPHRRLLRRSALPDHAGPRTCRARLDLSRSRVGRRLRAIALRACVRRTHWTSPCST
jgi:hypothetical protein